MSATHSTAPPAADPPPFFPSEMSPHQMLAKSPSMTDMLEDAPTGLEEMKEHCWEVRFCTPPTPNPPHPSSPPPPQEVKRLVLVGNEKEEPDENANRILVCVRCRPFNTRELNHGTDEVIEMDDDEEASGTEVKLTKEHCAQFAGQGLEDEACVPRLRGAATRLSARPRTPGGRSCLKAAPGGEAADLKRWRWPARAPDVACFDENPPPPPPLPHPL